MYKGNNDQDYVFRYNEKGYEYNKYEGRTQNMAELTDEQREAKVILDREWNKLKNALAFEYDGIYTMEELDLDKMRKSVKASHIMMIKLGYPLTELK